MTPSFLAKNTDPTILTAFFNAGISVDQTINLQNETLLFAACRNNNLFLCSKLLDAGADITHKNTSGQMAFDLFKLSSLSGSKTDMLNFFNTLSKHPASSVAVPFLREGSDILHVLILSYNNYAIAKLLYKKFPYLLEVKHQGENVLDRIDKKDIYQRKDDSYPFGFYQHWIEEKCLKPDLKDFLALVRQLQPRLFIEFVITDKRLIKDLMGNDAAVTQFIMAHSCQDLLPPPSQLTVLYNSIVEKTSYLFSNHLSDEEDPLIVEETYFYLEHQKAEDYPITPVTTMSRNATAKEYSSNQPLLAFAAATKSLNKDPMLKLPEAPTAPIEETYKDRPQLQKLELY